MDRVIIERDDFQKLIDALTSAAYQVIGPVARDGAIIYDDVSRVDDLPAGWTDEQEAGFYRLRKRDDSALFGYVVGPHSWKKFLHPPELRLWKATREGGSFHIIEEKKEDRRFAFIGVRSCELHAIDIQDKVFLKGQCVDPTYSARRENLFIVAVNCTQPGGTCFCHSMNTGPRATSGFDLALTEVLADGRHHFVVEIGSQAGREILQQIPHRQAQEIETLEAEEKVADAAHRMGRQMNTDGLKELLYASYEHPRWDDVAKRCLTCANCTLVCPTCFCATIEDVTDLRGENAERWRKWDSCFTMDFSYIHGGSIRKSTVSRYRQWMTHKLATWFDQFGASGCVGCGRCITWCPVGIDITEEARAMRDGNENGDGNA
jgi:formate hydrogenlyase subunit 6/NADH:ubiquinone oxidoreductase subunit I